MLIAEMLLSKELAIDINIKRHIARLEWKNEGLVEERVYLLTAKTKSMLFPSIDRMIRTRFADDMPEIYTLPIINMDWDQVRQLKEHFRDVDVEEE